MRTRLGLALVVSSFALVGCGGASTTTVIEKTVTAPGQTRATPTFLKAVAYEHLYVEPRVYPFTVDGSLVGKDLKWEGWGSATATGRGKIEERNFAGGFDDRPTYPGSVVATGLEECRGRAYYTEVVAEVPPDAIYVPRKASQLTTPCRSFESLKEEERPEPEPGEAAPSFFYMPSHNIACALSPVRIRCDIRNKSWSPPPKPANCQLDWGNSISVGATGGPTILCAGDTLLTGHYTVLPYGEIIARGKISCLSKSDGLTCINKQRDGFFLSFEELNLF
ncbi:MAG: hypothetical protein JWO14_2967 [Solirubrobacterales bacterium]|nr:hypothetical protein [Solirubrobacterales bacterium]